jgi:hypothetical protein
MFVNLFQLFVDNPEFSAVCDFGRLLVQLLQCEAIRLVGASDCKRAGPLLRSPGCGLFVCC